MNKVLALWLTFATFFTVGTPMYFALLSKVGWWVAAVVWIIVALAAWTATSLVVCAYTFFLRQLENKK